MKSFFIKSILFFILFANGLIAFQEQIKPYRFNKQQTKSCDIAICCVFQNEAEWLKEWIEFHRLIGVEHFYLYNNLSSDNYLAILYPYIQEGIVELFHFPVFPFKNTYQHHLYNHALNKAQGKNKWLAAIDTDEFIVPIMDNDLKTFLKKHECDGGVMLRWQTFGTSNVKTLLPGELLIEKLVLKAPPDNERNKLWKTILQTKLSTGFIDAHSAHYLNNATVYQPDYTEIRLNHYFMRTEDFLYQVKIPRILQWNVSAFTPETIIHYIPISNSVYDNSMERFVISLQKIIFSKNK